MNARTEERERQDRKVELQRFPGILQLPLALTGQGETYLKNQFIQEKIILHSHVLCSIQAEGAHILMQNRLSLCDCGSSRAV